MWYNNETLTVWEVTLKFSRFLYVIHPLFASKRPTAFNPTNLVWGFFIFSIRFWECSGWSGDIHLQLYLWYNCRITFKFHIVWKIYIQGSINIPLPLKIPSHESNLLYLLQGWQHCFELWITFTHLNWWAS